MDSDWNLRLVWGEAWVVDSDGHPFNTGCLPLNCSGNPGVNWRILQGWGLSYRGFSNRSLSGEDLSQDSDVSQHARAVAVWVTIRHTFVGHCCYGPPAGAETETVQTMHCFRCNLCALVRITLSRAIHTS